ncbi:MAG: VWA domain-containing protein [Acidobacteria bacterium]|nr:VWA domain-containing protein [Acidobacteriota bacterium]
MMRLAHPAWLVLAAVGVICLVLWTFRRLWQRYPFPVTTPWSGRAAMTAGATTLAGVLAAAAFVPLAVGAARPQEVLSRQLAHSQGVDIVIALDTSGSMAALDFRPSNRLEVAKKVISRFIAGRPNDRIGLVVFSGAAVTLCPLTLDHRVAQQLLARARLGMLPDGTAIGMGLGVAVNRLRHSKARSKVIVLVTDGSNNAGALDPMTAARLAAQQGIRVHTILVGRGGIVPIPMKYRDPFTGEIMTRVRRARVDVNPQLLETIARTTGGVAFRARSSDALAQIFKQIDRMEKTRFTSTKLVQYRERFEPWAFGALAMLLVGIAVETAAGRTPW